jgi:hypothetical protein
MVNASLIHHLFVIDGRRSYCSAWSPPTRIWGRRGRCSGGAVVGGGAAGVERLAPLACVEAELDGVIVHASSDIQCDFAIGSPQIAKPPGLKLAAMSVGAPGLIALMKIPFGLSAAAQ